MQESDWGETDGKNLDANWFYAVSGVSAHIERLTL